jgi:THO complex subunit 5
MRLLTWRRHKYKKLNLIPAEQYLDQFPEHQEYSEHELMTARIEHEHQARVKLIAEVKKGKDDLTKLDAMVEKFIEAAEPIKKVLATE